MTADRAALSQPAGKAEKKDKELTLKELFPEKGLFGPGARSTSFSHDGGYGAYLYRPYKERRHGNDFWIVDCETGKARRVTRVSVMAEFQADARKVKEARIKKAGKNGDQLVTLKLVMPDQADAELSELIEAWAKDHNYDPREDKSPDD